MILESRNGAAKPGLCRHKPRRVVAVGEGAPARPGDTPYGEYVAGRPGSDPVRPDRPHIYDETARLYTSGTTNRAKAVPINNINEVLSAHDVMMHFPLNATDRTMNMTPWFHRGGLHSGGLTPTLYAGAKSSSCVNSIPVAAWPLPRNIRSPS